MGQKWKIFPPSFDLKKKVGEVVIPSELIEKCQEVIEKNDVDIIPYATEDVRKLKEIKAKLGDSSENEKTYLREIAIIVMHLKANGGMFNYQLVSKLSAIMLMLLEKIEKTNSDFAEMLGVYINVIDIIVIKRLTGSGGDDGLAMTAELQAACQRYAAKYHIPL